MKATKIFMMAALALTFAACSNNDDIDLAQQPTEQPANGEITITATLDANDGVSTRALSIDGSNIASTWATTDQFAILYNNGTDNTKSIATVDKIDGTTVTITFTVSSSLANNTACTIVYPASAANVANTGADVATALATQNGTIGNCPEVRVGTATIDKDNHNLSSVTKLAAQNSIFLFTTKNSDGSAEIPVTKLTVMTGGHNYVITPSSATFYAALPAISTQPVIFTATGSDSKTYTAAKASVTIAEGKYYQSVVKMKEVPTGALIGQFSVSDTKKIFFSKGNLQYTKSTGIWSFMDHQYSTVETTSQAIGDDYASQDVVSLFGWGTSGWNNGNTYYQPYNTAYVSSSGSSKGYGYGPKDGTTYTYNLTGTYANADWGHNAISNGGNTAGTWRTLTKDEWTYLFNTRSASTVNGTANARYAKAYLFGTTHGVIIFPDVYTHPAGLTAPTGINATSSTSWDGNRYTAADWAKMEAAGCVFLPAAGWRDATTIRRVNEYVRYWTSTYYNAGYANNVGFENSYMNPADYNQKNYGYSVRLVHDAN